MAEFEFHIDQKETIWRRNYCKVEADSEEEAIQKMKASSFELDYDLHAYDSELIHETSDDMEYIGNNFQPTREIYYKGVRIEDNTPISVRRNKKINTIINEQD